MSSGLSLHAFSSRLPPACVVEKAVGLEYVVVMLLSGMLCCGDVLKWDNVMLRYDCM